MKVWMLPLLALLAASCSVVPTPVKTASGGAAFAVLLGGKGALEFSPTGGMSYVYSNERSFQHFTQAAVTAAGAIVAGQVSKAQEVTTQTANAAAAKTQQAKIAADAATQQLQIKTAAEVEKLKLVPAP